LIKGLLVLIQFCSNTNSFLTIGFYFGIEKEDILIVLQCSNEQFQNFQGSKRLDNDSLTYLIKGFLDIKTDQLETITSLLCILNEVHDKKRWLLDAFACHEAMLVISYDWREGED
jgi:hypothetical protein